MILGFRDWRVLLPRTLLQGAFSIHNRGNKATARLSNHGPRPGSCPLQWGPSSGRPLALGSEGRGLCPGSLEGRHRAPLTPRPQDPGQSSARTVTVTINAGIAGQVPGPLCASLVPSSQGKCRDQAHFTGEEAGAPEGLSDSPRADAWKWGRRIRPRHLGPKPSVTAGLPCLSAQGC